MNEYKDDRRGDSRQKMTRKEMGVKEKIGKKNYKAVNNSTKSYHLLSAS